MSMLEAVWSYLSGGALIQTLQWWAVLCIIGLLFFPLCMQLFGKFFDKGYAFSKVLGMITAVYLSWLAISLQLASFTCLTAIVAVIVTTMAGAVTTRKSGFFKSVGGLLGVMLLEEAMFLAALVFWGFIRSINPDIHGLEKFMDYAFMNSVMHSARLPPADPWLSGFSINYYYFGHFTYAWLAKLSGITPSVAYNLAMSTMFAFSFTLVYSIAANMVHLRRDCSKAMCNAAGAISAVLFSLGGNLFAAIYGCILPLLKQLGIYHGNSAIHYAGATRFVGYFPPTSDRLITEFPFYSFIVADLHAHVMSIPLVLTIIACCLVLIGDASDRCNQSVKDQIRGNYVLILWMIFLLGTSSLTNAWTQPTGALTICISAAMAAYLENGRKLKSALSAFFVVGLAVVMGTTLLTLPFQMNFTNFSQGVRFADSHTPFWQILILWGYQLLLAGWFFVMHRMYRKKNALKLGASEYAIFAFIASAVVLIAIPEFVYIKDIYGHAFRRANTVFKFTYEAFILLTVPTGYFAVMIVRTMENSGRKLPVLSVLIMFLYLPVTYTWLTFAQACKLPVKPRIMGIDGLAFMASKHPGDFMAAEWLKHNTGHNDVILEAEGDSYSDHGRISMMSGRQTVLGWYVHEWLWRNDRDVAESRRKDIRSIFEAATALQAYGLLHKYHVRYLVVGELEKKRYRAINLPLLATLGKTVYESDGTALIQLDYP